MRHTAFSLTLTLILSLSLSAGCRQTSNTSSPSVDGEEVPAFLTTSDAPLYRRTTSGRIAVDNLEAQTHVALARLRERPGSLPESKAAVGLLLKRASFLGTYRDFDEAVRLAQAAVDAHPGNPTAWLLRARVRAHLHEFDGALADLDRAESLHGDRGSIAKARTGISIARQENLDPALSLRQAAFDASPSYTTAADLAAVHVARGEWTLADARFDDGLAVYRDVSPFMVSWVFFQKGMMWAERAHEPEKAPRLYREAIARLPQYVQANVHLAELDAKAGRTDDAIARLRPLLDRSDDPEPASVLAMLLDRKGNHEEAVRMTARARAGYEALLAKYPLAFADHGAEFYLGPGHDPRRALELAELNVKNRNTVRARALLKRARLASDTARASIATASR